MKATELINSGKGYLQSHAPEILAGLGVVGVVGTSVLAAKATPKALLLLEEKEEYNFELKITDAKIKVDDLGKEAIEQVKKWKINEKYISSLDTKKTGRLRYMRVANEATKDKFLIASVEELEEHGVTDFSIRRVAQRCEVSCGAPYKHFKNKNELIQTVIDNKGLELNLYDLNKNLINQLDPLTEAELTACKMILIDYYILFLVFYGGVIHELFSFV